MSECKHIVDEPVNALLADSRHQSDDNGAMSRDAKYPNALAAFIERSGLSMAAVARCAGTSRQQIHSLATGARELTKPWAMRLAPCLHVQWMELLATEPAGMAEAPSYIAPPRAENMIDPEEAFAQIQEAVADMLQSEHLPHAQADIARVSRMVERDMIALGRMRNFEDGLTLTLSEVASSLKRKWAEALQRK